MEGHYPENYLKKKEDNLVRNTQLHTSSFRYISFFPPRMVNDLHFRKPTIVWIFWTHYRKSPEPFSPVLKVQNFWFNINNQRLLNNHALFPSITCLL